MTARYPDWPMVETDRLRLRPFEPGDLEAYTAIRSKPALARYMAGGEAGAAQGRAKATALIAAWGRDAWKEGGFQPWAVAERETGLLIGHLGLRFVDELDAVELLYFFDVAAQGRGYATEGARAALEVAADPLKLDRVVALAHLENAASMAVMERIGMRRVGPTQAFGLDCILYEITPIAQRL